ncbi:hypothetical protein ACP70R_028078 [Stipagrostis hirtigluma subsp. patula]
MAAAEVGPGPADTSDIPNGSSASAAQDRNKSRESDRCLQRRKQKTNKAASNAADAAGHADADADEILFFERHSLPKWLHIFPHEEEE